MSKVVNNTTNALGAYTRKRMVELRNLVADTAVNIEIQATRDAPKGFISIDKQFSNQGLTAEVGVMGENNLAAYFEFGTGLSAKEILSAYPQYVKDLAYQFYITGEGTLKGKPYLFPAVFRYTKEFERELKRLNDTNVNG